MIGSVFGVLFLLLTPKSTNCWLKVLKKYGTFRWYFSTFRANLIDITVQLSCNYIQEMQILAILARLHYFRRAIFE